MGYYSESARDASGWGWLERLFEDLRYSARSLRHSPSFTVALTLWPLRNDRLGFQPENVFTITIPLKGTKLENRSHELAADLVAFARRTPGTADAAQTEYTRLSGGAAWVTFSRPDRPLPEAFHRGDGIALCGAGAGYARAAGVRVVRGRFFTEDDTTAAN